MRALSILQLHNREKLDKTEKMRESVNAIKKRTIQ